MFVGAILRNVYVFVKGDEGDNMFKNWWLKKSKHWAQSPRSHQNLLEIQKIILFSSAFGRLYLFCKWSLHSKTGYPEKVETPILSFLDFPAASGQMWCLKNGITIGGCDYFWLRQSSIICSDNCSSKVAWVFFVETTFSIRKSPKMKIFQFGQKILLAY